MLTGTQKTGWALLTVLFLFLSGTSWAAATPDRHRKALPTLYKILEKGDVREKQAALEMLWFLERKEYHAEQALFDPVLELLTSKNASVRQAAIAMLKRLAEDHSGKFSTSDTARKVVIPALVRSLADTSALVRQEAAKALGTYQDPRAVQPLTSLLQDEHTWVRFEAIRALGRVKTGAAAVVPLLNAVAVEDVWPTTLLQREALKTLANILKQHSATVRQTKPRAVTPGHSLSVRKVIIDPHMRGKAITLILKKGNGPYLKADAIKLLTAMHVQLTEGQAARVMAYLTEAAGDPSGPIRTLALSALFSMTYTCVQDEDTAGRTGQLGKYRKIVIDLCITSLQDPSVEVSRKAAYCLGNSKDSKAVQPLILALNHPDDTMKVAVIKALGNFRDKKIIAPLLDTLSGGSETARIHVIKLLGEFADPRILQALPQQFGRFKKSEDNSVVIWSFQKVVKATTRSFRLVYHYNGKRFVAPIDADRSVILPHDISDRGYKLLRHHPVAIESLFRVLDKAHAKGHTGALRQLGQFEDKRIAQRVMPFLDSPLPEIQIAALPLVFWSTDTSKAKPIIQKALHAENARVRKKARELFQTLNATYVKKERPLEAYLAALKSPDAPTRRKAAEALKRKNDKRAVVPLIACLSDPDPPVRRTAANALQILEDNRAVEPLIKLLEDPDSKVRLAAIRALAKIKDPRAVGPLISRIEHDRRFTSSITSALQGFDDPRVADFFLEQLQNQHRNSNIAAVSYFSRNPDPRTVEFLILLLKSPHSSLPSSAASALGRTGDSRAVEPLIELLSRELPEDKKGRRKAYGDKRAAIQALANFDDGRIYPLLETALQDEKLKSSAGNAMGLLKDKRTVPVLLALLDDPSFPNKSWIMYSLGKMGDPSLFDTIEPYRSDPRGGVAGAAFRALFSLDPERAQALLMELLENGDPVTCERTLRKLGCSETHNVIAELLALSVVKPGVDKVVGNQLRRCANSQAKIRASLTAYLKEGNERDIRIAAVTIASEFDHPEIWQLLKTYANSPDPVFRRHVHRALEKPEPKDVRIATLLEEGPSVGYALHIYKGRSSSRHGSRVQKPIGAGAVRGGMVHSSSGKLLQLRGTMAHIHDPQIREFVKNYTYDDSRCVHLEFEAPLDIKTLRPRLNAPRATARQEAAATIGYYGDADAGPALIPLLADRAPAVRLSAARALGMLKHASAVAYLENSLTDPDAHVTHMAVWALGELEVAQAVPPLAMLLEKPRDIRLRKAAIDALARIESRQSKELLGHLLSSSQDYTARVLALEALARMGHAGTQPLVEAHLDDPNAYLRQAAVRSLRSVTGNNTVSAVIDLLDDPDFFVRKATLETLQRIDDIRFVDPLARLLVDEDKKIQVEADKVLRTYALNSDAKHKIGDIFIENIKPDNLKALRKSEKLMKILGEAYAIERLAEPGMNEPETVHRYAALMPLSSRSRDLSKLAKKALTDYPDRERMIDILISSVLNNSTRDVKRRETIYFLGHLKDPHAATLFMHILESPFLFNLGEERSACRYLGKIGYQEAVPLLIRRLGDRNEKYTVRMEAAQALGQIQNPKSVDPLIKVVNDTKEHQELRAAAIHAVGSIGVERVVIPLMNILRDTNANYNLRASAASAIGEIGTEQAIQILKKEQKALGASRKDKQLKYHIETTLKSLKIKCEFKF